MFDRALLRIDSILKHIDQILQDTDGLSADEIANSNSLLRATRFSISQIGETMNQLEKAFAEKYCNLPWRDARKMRNALVHDYGATNIEDVYATIHNDLPDLKTAFLAIKNDIMNGGILKTERLMLRKIKETDAEFIFKNWANDQEVAAYVTWPIHENIDVTNRLVAVWLEEEKNPKTIRYIITCKGNDEPIGSIDVVDYVDGNPEIGYALSRSHWNKGYMTEACGALIKYLFAIGFRKILIEADERNVGSNRVIEKCGFTFTHKEHKEQCSPFKPYPVTVNWYSKTK